MIFWDTSALVRCYSPYEPDHARALNLLLSSKGRHGASVLIVPEVISAIVRKLGRDKRNRESLLQTVETHFKEFDLFEVTGERIEVANRLVRHYGLRALDALHLASAILASREIGRTRGPFLTGDRDQASAARAEKLKVIEL